MSATPTPRLTLLLLGASALAAAAVLVAAVPALAEKVGVAAAVKPDAFSGGTEMKIGNSVFYNQRINTTGEGLVQVLLVDGSTFTVGPGSDLVIDKFVYDPAKKKGEVVATFGKGVLRFVGGKISKNEGGVTVNTPSGALAIRGGMFQGKQDHTGGTYSFLFGVELKFTGKNGQVNRVYQPGYTLETGRTFLVRPTRPEDTQFFMKALAGGGHVVVGGDNQQTNKSRPPNPFNKVEIAEITEEGTQSIINGDLQHEEHVVAPPTGGEEPSDAPPGNTRVLTSPNYYTTADGQDLSNPAGNPSQHGILGGDNKSEVTADDFEVRNRKEGNRLIGSVDIISKYQDPGEPKTTVLFQGKLDLPAEWDEEDCASGVCAVTDGHLRGRLVGKREEHVNYLLKGSAITQPGFVAYQLFNPTEGPWSPHDYGDSPFASRITTIQAFRAALSYASGVDLNNPILIISGDKYVLPSEGRVQEFHLYSDPRQSLTFGSGEGSFQNFVAPFATLEGSPLILDNDDHVEVSNLKVLQADSSGGKGVFLQTSLYIGDSGDGECDVMQQSVVVVALGSASNKNGLDGERRGGSQINAFTPVGNGITTHYEYGGDYGYGSQEHIAFTGGVSTLASANGAHFLGKNAPNIVVGADSTGNGHNIYVDRPLNADPSSDYASATYHVGVGSTETYAPGQQTSGAFTGYSSGMVLETDPNNNGALADPHGVNGDIAIDFNANKNTLSAAISTTTVEGNGGAPTLTLGNPDGSGKIKSAFIDNQNYAAIEKPNSAGVNLGTSVGYLKPAFGTSGYLVSGEQLNVTSFFPETFENTNGKICNNCGFLKWGAWGWRGTYKPGTNPDNLEQSVTGDVHLGWWVAGNVIDAGDLPTQGSASYEGHVLGNVANNIHGNGWKTYVAAGDMDMTWNFQPRSGTLNITRFDTRNVTGGLNFTSAISNPNPLVNKFTGNLGLTPGQYLPPQLSSFNGFATGSFVKGPGFTPGSTPGAVIGNWNVGNNAYKATGIFAGGHVPGPD